MDNDAAREQLADVLDGLQDQLDAIAAAQKAQAALSVTAQGADGTIEVTVNARGQVVKTVVDETYLDEHEFDEIGEHITAVAQAAARDAGLRVAEILAPVNAQYEKYSSLLDIAGNGGDFRDLVLPGLDGSDEPRRAKAAAPEPGDLFDHGSDTDFPRERR